ncbi:MULTISPECIES: tRNA (adenosine(37)-N6)-threonylcarbamoyltransferase complex dimerization subunit type 1 TsaB [unclassified Dyella]|uniref:tRNA (adenosine(37)-N6)-threonylcarbamoyltransferase complex dimerization subunit type 1 TsaB n=1 Tax=unclassified Dyella TaxID=2634549 RepID=UPI000C86206B|nr:MULTISPECIES: tRNA (adenosine(37)-N6)-threonylcarbamoyltransferase complex dimerization subunit type 1 TsaB [unclassified Dyella]MDR3445226.1 tRNA (adenosine(37)-N6)-threonylcarbamoyltransferase complex dimerization subunit type 1 TsaB [Dyella sp.]PMQ07228.1 tRNA threonylcarbamoyladenosine biosynthesis protein TsaB [Dyella sp. AD56]
MKLLAIETSTEACSVALIHGDEVIARSEIAPRRHAELVLPMADALLAEAGLGRHALDVIAVGRGPGAFTGVRLGISLAQGMALALDVPVVTVSSLAALALEAPEDDADILAVIDARMGEIYAASYRRDDNGGLVVLDEERVCTPGALSLSPSAAWHVVGTGWTTYEDVLRPRLTGALRSAEGARYPQARHVAELAAREFSAGHAHAPEHALPVYLRDKVALTLVEQGKA